MELEFSREHILITEDSVKTETSVPDGEMYASVMYFLKDLCDDFRFDFASLAFLTRPEGAIFGRTTYWQDGRAPKTQNFRAPNIEEVLFSRGRPKNTYSPWPEEAKVIETGQPLVSDGSEVEGWPYSASDASGQLLVLPLNYQEGIFGVLLAGLSGDEVPEDADGHPLVDQIQAVLAARAFLFARLWLTASGRSEAPHPLVVGETEEWEDTVEHLQQAAEFEFPVYIYGERGTGKELATDFIHHFGPRANEPFVKVNCASIPESISESELFGHRAGAFTGATTEREGRFMKADGGTLLLDEIGELSMDNQKKLLRVIQTGEITPLGAGEPRQVDVRVICSTNTHLEGAVRRGNFRSDLFDRLNVLKLNLPPLRRWKGKIPELAGMYLKEVTEHQGSSSIRFSEGAFEELKSYSYPGNCRELYNIVRKLFVRVREGQITARDVETLLNERGEEEQKGGRSVPVSFRQIFANSKNPSVLKDRAEFLFLKKSLKEHDGNVDRISDDWGCSRQNIYRLCNKHDLTPREFRS